MAKGQWLKLDVSKVRTVLNETYNQVWIKKMEARLWEHVDQIEAIYRELRVYFDSINWMKNGRLTRKTIRYQLPFRK
jgi:hypothetical protein